MIVKGLMVVKGDFVLQMFLRVCVCVHLKYFSDQKSVILILSSKEKKLL